MTDNLRMNAYYYGFEPTGVELIDRILSAVACAGKAYHHTESWCERTTPYENCHRGNDPIDWIQNAANDAAAAWNRRTEPAGSAEPINLLPLPEPEFYVWMDAFNIQRMGRKAPEHVHSRPYFSTRQMRDYARTALSTQSTHQPDVSIKAGEIDMEKERERFEKWAGEKYPLAERKDSLGGFSRDMKRSAWDGWQARASQQQSVAQVTDDEILDDASAYGLNMGDCYEFSEDDIIKFARALLAAKGGE